ncbi:putative oxidoreductase [Podospora appendiculata]|uniref:Oxidoreductase n=1 Tax=Podospora appendiculata TaxID=314037 RepID=A0AAE0X4D6_9PEZI|nr:putative oxidoreductase [Podospora appendiculata]
MPPQLIFGTASFGDGFSEFQDVDSVRNLLVALDGLGIRRLDTAARYPPFSQGRSEELIGEARPVSDSFLVDTKSYTNTATDGSGDLTRDALEKSVAGSLARLQQQQGEVPVNVLYTHRPDPSTPLEEQIQAFNQQVAERHCQHWGVSNTPPAMLQDILDLCDRNGWQKPRYYQGCYNLITRGMEKRLLPILRAHGMQFVAYQSLAAGFLTGKLVNNEHADTRFGDKNPLGKLFRQAFAGDQLSNALRDFDTGVKGEGLTPIEVAVRWIVHHSSLGDGDGVILGATKMAQVVQTVAMAEKGPLPPTCIKLADTLWEAVADIRGHLIQFP